MTTHPVVNDTFLKAPHRRGCEGRLHNTTLIGKIVHVDKAGRIGNGGIVCHDYRCNMHWDGCPARVLVRESAVRLLAVAVEKRS